jgi:molybdopterin converting factor small subunit
VRQLLGEILRLYPALRRELLNDKGELYGHVHIIVNGRDVPYLQDQMETVLAADDVISVFPAVGGG